MQITVYQNFTKRKNSTKQPSANSGTQMNVLLKSETSLENPSFILATNDATINYIKAFDTYFFVDNVIALDNGRFEYVCSKDYCATYKSNIINSKAYIQYATSNYDENIVDSRLSVKSTKTITGASVEMPLFNTTGCYILSVANNVGGASGFASQYVITSALLEQVSDAMYGNTILENLKNQLISPMNAIINCIWIPIDYGECVNKTDAQPIILGKENTNIMTRHINTSQTVIAKTYTINIPWTYNDFRRNAPYTTMSLYIPFYGLIDINTGDIVHENSIMVNIAVDIANGEVTLTITGATTGKILQTISYSVAVNCPISQVTNNATGVLSSTFGAVGGAVATGIGIATGGAGAIVTGVGATIVGAGNAVLDYNRRTTSVKGSIQGKSSNAFGTNLLLNVFSQDTDDITANDYRNIIGRCVGKVMSLSSFSGYVQTVNASVNMAGHGSDKDTVNNMLDTGIYIE